MPIGACSRTPPGFWRALRQGHALLRNKEVLAGFPAIATPGHSVGHASFVLSSGAQRIHPGGRGAYSVLVRPIRVLHRSITTGCRSHAPKVYDMLVGRKRAGSASIPFPALAHVERTAGGWREFLIPWIPTSSTPEKTPASTNCATAT